MAEAGGCAAPAVVGEEEGAVQTSLVSLTHTHAVPYLYAAPSVSRRWASVDASDTRRSHGRPHRPAFRILPRLRLPRLLLGFPCAPFPLRHRRAAPPPRLFHRQARPHRRQGEAPRRRRRRQEGRRRPQGQLQRRGRRHPRPGRQWSAAPLAFCSSLPLSFRDFLGFYDSAPLYLERTIPDFDRFLALVRNGATFRRKYEIDLWLSKTGLSCA